MNAYSPVIESHAFAADDYIAGDPALDFVNTVTGRDASPRDWLDGYPRLVEWASRAELLPARTLRSLTRRAQQDPAAARKALARAKALREALFEIVAAIARRRSPPREALALLRDRWIEGAQAHELAFQRGRVTPRLSGDAADLDLIASMVAWRLVTHVLPTAPERIRICAGPRCSWLFIDRSKAGRRRWCDMAVCGNAAKSRRFYARQRTVD